jgi:carbon storage regulator
LTRRAGEAVIINNAIEVRVVEVRGRTVRLGFRFPPEASVLREEVFLQIRCENEAAAKAAADGPVDLALLQELDQAVDPGKAKPR